jgi:hypothetical protein
MDFSAQMIFVPVSGVVTLIGNESSLLLMGTESLVLSHVICYPIQFQALRGKKLVSSQQVDINKCKLFVLTQGT